MLRLGATLLALGASFSSCEQAVVAPATTVSYQLLDTDLSHNARCHLRSATLNLESTADTSVALFARGAEGWRWFQGGRTGSVQSTASEPSPVAGLTSVVWAGAAWVAGTARGLSVWSAEAPRARAVALQGHVCEPLLRAVPGGALALYRQASGSDCEARRLSQPVLVQRLDTQGAPLGPPQTVQAAPTDANGLSGVQSYDLRCDDGSCVAELTTLDQSRSFYLLSTLGTVNSHGSGRGVLCPAAGCLRMSATQGSSTGAVGLRVDLLGRTVGFVLPFSNLQDLESAAVWRDFALFTTRVDTGGGVPGTQLGLLDVAGRHLVAFDVGTAEVYTVWNLPAGQEHVGLYPDSDGFVLVTRAPSLQSYTLITARCAL